jgi:O-antigen biosynthesis protein
VTGRRITLVADELRGIQGGGLGTVFTYLAIALARLGNSVDVLYFGLAPATVEPAWTETYDRWGVTVNVLPPSRAHVEPAHFGRLLDIDSALDASQPEVVIAQDLAGAAYVPLRRRHLGLGFDDTLFVVRCSGTRRWISDAARKVGVHPGALAVTVLEQAALELADVVVAESRYMVDWMRDQGWRLPERTHVIPSVLEWGATGEPAPQAAVADDNRVQRLVFFGRLEERKGIRPFLDALNELDSRVLAGIELEFLGPATAAWPPQRVRTQLHVPAFRSVRFLELDRQDALAHLSDPGTLAVMPSLEDNSPSTVYECLSLGIPFLASRVGGTEELVDARDRDRVLFEPTPEGIRTALQRALADGVRPARAAFADESSLRGWEEIASITPRQRNAGVDPPPVDVIVVEQEAGSSAPTLAALARTTYAPLRVVLVTAKGPDRDVVTIVETAETSVDAMRDAGLAATNAPWVIFLDAGDVPVDAWVEQLVRAQAASGADVVTCAVELTDGTQRFFLGEPHGLGVISNAYGAVALVRRSLLAAASTSPPRSLQDPDWRLLAALAASSATIVSVPAVLVRRSRHPGDASQAPEDALLVVGELERILPGDARTLARLAAGLAASSVRPADEGAVAPGVARGLRQFLAARRVRSFRSSSRPRGRDEPA